MDILKWLHKAELVADIQRFFGIERVINKSTATSCSSQYGNSLHQKETSALQFKKKHKRDDSDISSSSDGRSVIGWATAILNDDMVGSSGIDSEGEKGTLQPKTEQVDYVIKNRFWYHLFQLATKTGDEIFYILFFPFWAWNVDGAVFRRILVIWMITMYTGQALKDILKVPRPRSPPVVKLDPKWGLEYGLPSTHAMVAFSIPFSVVALSVSRYQLDWGVCYAIAAIWCFLVCLSRIYLGMHSVLDIVCGLVLASGVLGVFLPLIDTLDHVTLTHPLSPLLALVFTVSSVVCYPATDRWTPARGDTAVIMGVGCGCLVGSWLNYQLGVIRETSLSQPYSILWPSVNMVGLTLVRTGLGLALLLSVRAVFKTISLAAICAMLQVSQEDYRNKCSRIPTRHRSIVEICYKFITYVAIGVTIVFTGPLVFRIIGVERHTFYTEV